MSVTEWLLTQKRSSAAIQGTGKSSLVKKNSLSVVCFPFSKRPPLTMRDYDAQVGEAIAMIRALNKMTKAGIPEIVRIA